MRDWDREGEPDAYSGFLGSCSDEDDLFLRSEMKILEDFDFRSYRRKTNEENRNLVISWRDTPKTIQFFADRRLPAFFDQVPTVDVYRIPPEPDAGPGSGSWYVFLMADGCTRDEVVATIGSLRRALDTDLKHLTSTS